MEWNESVRFGLSFYQQVGISDISVYIISTEDIVTDSQYNRVPMINGTLVLNINKVLNYIEFSLNSMSSFKIQEILITYWTHGTKQNIIIPCSLVNIPVGVSPQNVAFIVISVGIILFVIGLITPIIIYFVRKNNYFRGKKREGNNLENNNNRNKEERTQHVYTDIRSHESAAEIKLPSQYSINGTEIRAEVPVPERELSPNITTVLEDEVRTKSLDRKNKQNNRDSPIIIEKRETFMEENSLYESRSISKKKEMKRFVNLERGDSEVVLSENPHYVSNEQMKMTTTTTPITTVPKTEDVTYENTVMSRESDQDFVGYDKLNHI